MPTECPHAPGQFSSTPDFRKSDNALAARRRATATGYETAHGSGGTATDKHQKRSRYNLRRGGDAIVSRLSLCRWGRSSSRFKKNQSSRLSISQGSGLRKYTKVLGKTLQYM
jgi:hypothetical protein